MKVAIWIFAVLVMLGLVWGLSQFIAGESGEVVVLTTRDDLAEAIQTRIWVVDFEGRQWIRAGSSMAGWYGRLTAHPDIQLARQAVTKRYTAVPAPEKRAEINRLMLAKYGWADRYIGFYFPRDNAIPVRLDPR